MSKSTPTTPQPDGGGSTALDRTVEPFRRALRRFGLLLLLVMTALPALQVFLRTVVHKPFVGAEELARFMLICVVFVTLPYVVSSGGSIRMEEILSAFPRALQRPLRVLAAGVAAGAFGVGAYSVAVATLRNLHNATPSLGIPYWVFFSTAFFGLFFAAVESAVQFVKALGHRPLYVTFAEEQPPEEVDLERALARDSAAGESR
ncbi:MAG: TRAP transporter small permease [Zetaproteobacteria bacterium]|nr:MAG: TRAP transporter small permease [Zetaproteobacteria bacterium]